MKIEAARSSEMSVCVVLHNQETVTFIGVKTVLEFIATQILEVKL
jgi:hypothetical protein